MTDTDDGDDTVASRRRRGAEAQGQPNSTPIEATDATALGSRRRSGPGEAQRAGETAPTQASGRTAYAPDAETLRSSSPVRAPHPVIVARRGTTAEHRGDRVPDSSNRAGADRGSRARARMRAIWLACACAAAALAAAGALVVVLHF